MCSENLTVEHILLSSEFNEEYRKLWELQKDRFLINLFDIGLNYVDSDFYDKRTFDDIKINEYLSKLKPTLKDRKLQPKEDKRKLKIRAPSLSIDFKDITKMPHETLIL